MAVPKIRFQGFTEDWEQRKVSELLEERNEQAPESSDYPLMAFIANIGVAPKGERYDRGALVKDAENKLYKRTEIGDFIYSSNNLETGSIGLNNYGNACISPVYSIFKPTGIADSDFIGRRFIRKDFINSMVKWRQGVVYGQWKIHESDFMKIQVAVPSLEEQRKIGEFLSSLDNLITLHQRKLESMKLLKKSLLQKMFPKSGETVPEVRFPGFTDAWEQRKLSNIAEKIYGGGTPKTAVEAYWNGKIPWIQSKDVNEDDVLSVVPQKRITEEAIANSATKLIPGNSIAIVTRVGVGKLAYMPFSYCTSQDFLSLSKLSINGMFATYAIYKMLQAAKRETQGTSIKGIPITEMLDKTISVPSDTREQEKIGTFFRNIDHTITLHQRKVEALQKLKKSLLQQMFV